MTKKKLNKMLNGIFEARGVDAARDTLDRVKLLGYDMATISGITWAISELVIPKEKPEILRKAEEEVAVVASQFAEGLFTDWERKARAITIWKDAQAKIGAHVATILPHDNSVYQIVDSGARGSWTQPMMMMGMKGLVSNPKGETIELPIKSSLKEGLSVLEYFIATHGARKGTTDTALKTAQAGYLTRRLVDVSQELTVREEDCRAKEGIELRREDGKESNTYESSQATGSAALIETITTAMYEKRRKTVERANYLREMAEMHREIYRAIRAHDPVEARKQMEHHLHMAESAQNMELPTCSAPPPCSNSRTEAP